MSKLPDSTIPLLDERLAEIEEGGDTVLEPERAPDAREQNS